MTSSLFATTLLASFVVVGLPHVLPCPRPATRRLDGTVTSPTFQQQQQQQQQEQVCVDENGRPLVRRRRRKCLVTDDEGAEATGVGKGGLKEGEKMPAQTRTVEMVVGVQTRQVQAKMVQFEVDKDDLLPSGDGGVGKRECPIPKPGGIIGDILGFRKNKEKGPTSSPQPPASHSSPSIREVLEKPSDGGSSATRTRS
ncbi:alpha-1,3-mannosyltransferase (Alg3) [Zalerion maritima]|uniref:Alpha-1,3-mannosyltransferase (Alg3) n=1 Tax=Zalerion maritima TaxID=339359 RepID=A0AAD5S6L7_9PEZI|nr:alpha-1,3-mannosyltransferase (Alg3) [Zalerion maritima]